MKIKITCKICNLTVESIPSIVKKSASLRNDCCSLVCFKQTRDYAEKRKLADLQRVKKIRETGSFSDNGSRSKLTRAVRFLKSVNVDVSGLDETQIVELWLREFREKANHGEKIIKGRNSKYSDPESLKTADRTRVLKACCTRLGIEYSENFTEDEKGKITKEAFKNFRVKDTMSWKVKHIVRHFSLKEIESLDEDKINALYSEYVSFRFSRKSLETTRNGWTRSEKGWYEMISQPEDKFFYRSSWEKSVFEALDVLVSSSLIKRVVSPDRIQYEFSGVKRHYYPDAAFVNSRNTLIVLEIKPSKKIEEIDNAVKIAAAYDKLGSNFHVLTENEIYGGNLLRLLEDL